MPIPDFLTKRSTQIFLFIFVSFCTVWIIVYIDLVFRARAAYQEGEKYMVWHNQPEKKAADIKQVFDDKRQKLETKRKSMSEEEYQTQMATLEFDEKYQREESSLKYAYVWYKDTYELFSPPESSWVKKAREKAPLALELWKQELREKKIPFEESMVE